MNFIFKTALLIGLSIQAFAAVAATDYGSRDLSEIPANTKIVIKKSILIKANDISTDIWGHGFPNSCQLVAQMPASTDRMLDATTLTIVDNKSTSEWCTTSACKWYSHTIQLANTDGKPYPLTIQCKTFDKEPLLNDIVKDSPYIGAFIIPSPDKF